MENRKNAGLSLIAMAALCLCTFAYMADLVIIPIGDAIFSAYAAFGVMGLFGKDMLSAVFPHLLLLCLLGAAVSVLTVRRMKKPASAAK